MSSPAFAAMRAAQHPARAPCGRGPAPGKRQLDPAAALGTPGGPGRGGEQVGDLDTGLGRNALTGLTGGQRR